jgi:hypothetical protein
MQAFEAQTFFLLPTTFPNYDQLLKHPSTSASPLNINRLHLQHQSSRPSTATVVRSLNKRAIQRHFNCLRGPPVVGTPNATNDGIHDQWETKAKMLFEEHQYKQVYLKDFFSEDRALPVDGREKHLYLGLEQGLLLKGDSLKPTTSLEDLRSFFYG